MKILDKFFKRKKAKAVGNQPQPFENKIENKKRYFVYIEDKYYDHMIDNDDMEDIPTIIKVTYDERGNIINKEFPVSIHTTIFDDFDKKRKYKFKSEDEFHDISSMGELQHFYRTCGINPWRGIGECKKYSIYKEPWKK